MQRDSVHSHGPATLPVNVSPFSLGIRQVDVTGPWSLRRSFRSVSRGLELPWQSTEQGAAFQDDKHRLTSTGRGNLLVKSCCAQALPVVSKWAVSSFKAQSGLKVSFTEVLVIPVCRGTAREQQLSICSLSLCCSYSSPVRFLRLLSKE